MELMDKRYAKMKLMLTRITALAVCLVPHAQAQLAVVEPAEGAVLTLNIPHFQWERQLLASVEDMPAYDVQIATDKEFARVVDEDRVAAVISRYVPDKELAPNDYWWRMATLPTSSPGVATQSFYRIVTPIQP